MAAANGTHRFRFSVLGRYQTQLKGNQPHVTVNMASGTGDHFIFCGTLTMSEPEWEDLVEALTASLGDRLEIDRIG